MYHHHRYRQAPLRCCRVMALLVMPRGGLILCTQSLYRRWILCIESWWRVPDDVGYLSPGVFAILVFVMSEFAGFQQVIRIILVLVLILLLVVQL